MLTVNDYERIRIAYYVEGKSIRQIGREYGHGYWTVRKALDRSEPAPYQLSEARAAPVLGAYKAQIEALLAYDTDGSGKGYRSSTAQDWAQYQQARSLLSQFRETIQSEPIPTTELC
jgi:transposase